MKIELIKPNSIHFSKLIHQELLLWPCHEYDELYKETLESKDYFFGAIKNLELLGFIQVSIRNEYVNGSTTSPVGYIEGLYVEEVYRKQGVGRRLVEYIFKFFKDMGIKEVASDALINNKISQMFHERLGFFETERVVYYLKELNEKEEKN
ncbi:MAG: GNAT family N-acetyltransferase [Bacilli bacterium]|nr:GNAT family N-acetyltransferase [Bacilli bacterium]